MRLCFLIPAYIVILSGYVQAAPLETVDDDELLNLIRSEKYVVALFTKKDCEQCENFENELVHLREDLVDSLNAWVVKVFNSQLVRVYNPTKEPSLVFFRHGVPLLYEGPLNDEVILHTFMENKEPSVKELTDDSFEYLTQAATGATTGDWFIMFYGTDCVDCQRLQARWESVGARLKRKMNVARVNKQTTGAVTGRRFGVWELPTFILFRHGKMYRYNLRKYDSDSFVGFATEWYKHVKGDPVPLPKTPFDDFTQMIADYLRDNPMLWKIGSIGFGLITLWIVVNKVKSQKSKQSKETKKAKVSKPPSKTSKKTDENKEK